MLRAFLSQWVHIPTPLLLRKAPKFSFFSPHYRLPTSTYFSTSSALYSKAGNPPSKPPSSSYRWSSRRHTSRGAANKGDKPIPALEGLEKSRENDEAGPIIPGPTRSAPQAERWTLEPFWSGAGLEPEELWPKLIPNNITLQKSEPLTNSRSLDCSPRDISLARFFSQNGILPASKVSQDPALQTWFSGALEHNTLQPPPSATLPIPSRDGTSTSVAHPAVFLPSINTLYVFPDVLPPLASGALSHLLNGLMTEDEGRQLTQEEEEDLRSFEAAEESENWDSSLSPQAQSSDMEGIDFVTPNTSPSGGGFIAAVPFSFDSRTATRLDELKSLRQKKEKSQRKRISGEKLLIEVSREELKLLKQRRKAMTERGDLMEMLSVKRKRKLKMNKHKRRKLRKEQRALRKKQGK